MIQENDFIQQTASRFAEAINEQIAIVVIDRINKKIDLDRIIANDLENRIKQYKESKEKLLADGADDIAEKLVEPTIEFKTIQDKLTYAFQALIYAGYTFTQDVIGNGEVVIKFFKIDEEFRYNLITKYSASIKEKIN